MRQHHSHRADDRIPERLDSVDVGTSSHNSMDRVAGWAIDSYLCSAAGIFAAEEAALLSKQLNAGMVIPCQHEMFEFKTVPIEGFVNAATKMDQRYRV